MISDLSLSWKSVGVIAALFCIVSRIFNRRATGEPVKQSFTGRVGGHLMAHAVISTITGILGFNIIMALLSIVLAIPLMLIGAKVELPESVKAWPRGLLSTVKSSFIDKKDEIKEKIHDAKNAVLRKVTGKKDAPMDSDEFWGGAPDPNATEETIRNEWLTFDALPPAKKIAAMEAAKSYDDPPKELIGQFAPIQWYKVRTGRSIFTTTTLQRIEMYKVLWAVDQHHASRMDAKTRLHFTRLSPQMKNPDLHKCWESFGQLLPTERFATLLAAKKLKCPLPDSYRERKGHPRDEQFYEVRACSCSHLLLTGEELEDMKNAAFEAMEEEQALAVRKVRNRPAQFVKTTRHKAADIANDLKDKAEDGVKAGAKGLFWKAMGY